MSESECSEDDGITIFSRLPKRIRHESFCDTVVYNPGRYHAPMHISDLLKRFKAHDANNDGGTGRASGLSIPSASSRRSFIVSPAPSRGGTGRGTRLRFPIEVDVKGQDQWDELIAKEGLIVVDAYASWCGPCKAIESTFRRIRNESGDDLLHFAIAETGSIESLAMYREKSRPTFLFYGGGQLINVIRGCNAPMIISSITQLLKEEHKILNGENERKQFIDTEVQKQELILDEKKDEEKTTEAEEEEEDELADLVARFNMSNVEQVVVEVPKEISIAIIKPDALKNGYADSIIKSMEESGIEILHKEEKILSKEEAAEFYKQHEGSDHFEQLIDFMSSGPVLTLVLSKKGEDAGYGLIPEIRDMIGPKDVNVAKEQAPDSIRAQYGTDEIKNAVHACDSSESAARELAFFFPDFNVPKVHEKQKKKRIQRTLALIRPDAYMKRKESILGKVQESGFTIAMSKEMHLSREQAEEFYSEHKDEDYFESLINNMTSGPSLALCLAREDAVAAWRNLLGPKDVAEAKEAAPESLRAVFAEEDAQINPLHGAGTPEEAQKELHQFFPLQSTVAVIKPEAYEAPEQKDEIIKKIQESGFKISAQKEVNLTKDLAAQFYKEHEGKEFYDGLTDYMSSGPTLFLILSKEDAIPGFRALVGPNDPDQAKEEDPNSLRALFATDSMRNAVHSSSNAEKATEAIHEFFPEVELNPDGTVKEPPKKVKSKHGSESRQEDTTNASGEQGSVEEGEKGESEQEGGQQQDGDQQEGQQQEGQQQEGQQQEGEKVATDQQGEAEQPSEGSTEQTDKDPKDDQKTSDSQPTENGEVVAEENKDEVNNNETNNVKANEGAQQEGGDKENNTKEGEESEGTEGKETSDDVKKEETQNDSQSSTSDNQNGNNTENNSNESQPVDNETENKETTEETKNNENEGATPESDKNNSDAAPDTTAAAPEQNEASEKSTEPKKTEGENPE